MTGNATAPQFNFTVSVDINTSPATFVIYDQAGNPTTSPVEVTVNNTIIEYTLVDNTDGLIFVTPDISDDPNNDLSYEVINGGLTLKITDSDVNVESICLKLVVAKSSDPSQTYTSPDPLIKNRPPQ